jgi:LysR family hydrogen peroxide-inducible transcriptional activator
MAVAAETARGTLETARFAAPAPGRTLGLAFRASTARTEDYAQLAEIIRAQRPE